MPSYIETVEIFFVGAIRKGLTLRNADIEMIREWENRGIPLDVVRKGISDGMSRFVATADPEASLPTALRYYRSNVEEAFSAYERAVARGMIVRTTATTSDAKSDGSDMIEIAKAILDEWIANETDGWKKDIFENIAVRLNDDDGTAIPLRLNSLDLELRAMLSAKGNKTEIVSLVGTVLERLD